jgi:hypothetical protein
MFHLILMQNATENYSSTRIDYSEHLILMQNDTGENPVKAQV